MSTWLSDSGNFLGKTNSVLISTSRYFYTGEIVLSKTADSEMVSLMTDNMYQVGNANASNSRVILETHRFALFRQEVAE